MWALGQCEKIWNQRGRTYEGAAKKWLTVKVLIATIKIDLWCLIPASLWISTKFIVIKFLPCIITAISCPFFFSHFFTLAILNGATHIFTDRLFLKSGYSFSCYLQNLRRIMLECICYTNRSCNHSYISFAVIPTL